MRRLLLAAMLALLSAASWAKQAAPAAADPALEARMVEITSELRCLVCQNQPNPWVGRTMVGFHLPQAATATLTVYDETGRVLFTQKGDFAKGYNAISLDRAMLNTTGLLYYKLETATDSATRKMIQTK